MPLQVSRRKLVLGEQPRRCRVCPQRDLVEIGRPDSDPSFEDEAAHLIGRWVTGRAIAREPGILSFFYVDHVADAIARVVANGGEVVDAPFREGDVWVARLRDPAGNTVGLWQFAAPAQPE
jgi:predicted enzyme related to lactoylglutathione lyase